LLSADVKGLNVTSAIDFSSLLDEFLEDGASHLDAAEAALIDLEKSLQSGNPDPASLTLLLGHLHTMKGNAGMMGLSPLQKYIHTFESVLKPVADGISPVTAALCEFSFATFNALRNSLHNLAENPAEPLDLSNELMELNHFFMSEAGDIGGAEAMAGKTTDLAYATKKSGTLKVNFEKLDDLLNLVGELVIQRTALISLEARLKEAVSDRALLDAFSESSQSLGKTANDLRESIMKVRMLPIKGVFQRFTRLVRDLSRRHGKEIELLFEGEETEIDKTVIDEIGEPLLHLIRNAVDHGIEPPGERGGAGKPPTGTLKLRACHENNNIVISVEDDGRGISVDRIKESALAKGLIDSVEAQALTDQEAFQLVFLPGFSTSREVTETSGRGIGLDVVKKAVVALNGTIAIASAPGRGTCFTISLPLTLAIIQALMVEMAGETFAIPLSGVLESIRMEAAEIHQVASGELIKLRDRLLPIVRLDRFFGIRRAVCRDTEYVVVVGSGEKRGGIVVDRLLGQQEIVIKAMDDYLGELPGIAGGTVLGDGRVSLIIDIAALIGMNGGASGDGAR
jgi:two-component system, chemotaxis family, sensor kinase CheA